MHFKDTQIIRLLLWPPVLQALSGSHSNTVYQGKKALCYQQADISAPNYSPLAGGVAMFLKCPQSYSSFSCTRPLLYLQRDGRLGNPAVTTGNWQYSTLN